MEIWTQDLCKSYHGRMVLDHVTFTAGDGVTCIMAPSGRGKTTLMRILLGLETADSGTVRAEGRWAAVFQEDRLLEHLDAAENLRFVLGAEYDGIRVSALLEDLGLGDAGGRPVREFSGGMRRRLALARALLARCDALALDEPFTGLDGETRARALDCLRRCREDRPALLVTHREEDAAELGAKIVRLS